MANDSAQVNQVKKLILQQTRSHEHTAALKLFYKTFNKNHPVDPEFLSRFYNELNKLGLVELGFRLLQETSSWHPEDEELQELRATAMKVYFDSLILEGATLLTDREEKENKFIENLKQTGSLAKQKVREENEKLLTNMALKALDVYKKAYDLNKDSLYVLNGLCKCYTALHDDENAEHFAMLAEEKSTFTLPQEQEEKEDDEKTKEEFKVIEFDIEEFNVNEVNSFYDQGKYFDVIKRVDFLHLSHKSSVPLLVLKAKAFAKLKKFKLADRTLFEAERYNTHLKLIKESKNDLLEEKFRLLTKAGEVYLTKALELGSGLGQQHFQRACICFEKALVIFPDNIDLLDSLYTCMKYLKKEEQAFRTKALIYRLNPKWIPTADRDVGGLCFIAGYAYQSQLQFVDQFRWFRREFLLNSHLGRYLNSCYVRNSPKVVTFAKMMRLPPRLFRFLLFPLLKFINVLKIFIDKYCND